MASTISSINVALVEQRVVAALRYVLPMLDAFSFRCLTPQEAANTIQNDSVYVPIATDPSAASKTAGTAVTAGGTLAGTQVQLSNFYGAAWDANEGAMSPSLMPKYWADKAAGAVYVLAKTVIDAALALVTATNYSNVEGTDKLTVAAGDFGQKDLADLWKIAETKIKQRQRSLGLNATYAAALMSDASLALTFANAGGNFLSTGMLPTLLGMNTWAYGAFPANSESLGGAVFGKGAIAVAVAPQAALMEAGDGDIIDRRVITDPESGISVLYTMTGAGGGNVHGECSLLYGVAKGQNAVVRLVGA